MRTRKNREAYHLCVLLYCSLRYRLLCLVEARVYDLHTGITQGSTDHFGPPVVPVQAWFSYYHSDFAVQIPSLLNLPGEQICRMLPKIRFPISYTHLRAHETKANLVCRLLLEKKKT